jgi:hypothetical protein
MGIELEIRYSDETQPKLVDGRKVHYCDTTSDVYGCEKNGECCSRLSSLRQKDELLRKRRVLRAIHVSSV